VTDNATLTTLAPLPAERAVVAESSFLTLHYRMSGPDGSTIVDTFDGKPSTLSMGAGALSPAIERCLVGMQEGDRRSFTLAPDEAFGPRNPAMVQRVAKDLLRELGDPDAEYHVGDVVQFPAPSGGAAFAGVVRERGEGWLLFDFNHPLAGRAVTFEAHVIGVL
jgi:FKBP-type peptidyl-prolyl cis-trans isomerase SlpA